MERNSEFNKKTEYIRETIFMSDQMKLIIAPFREVSDKDDLLVYLAIYV